MVYLFVGSFVLGLVLSVRAMLHGIERPTKAHVRGRTVAPPDPTAPIPAPAPTASTAVDSATKASLSPSADTTPIASPSRRFALNLPTTAGFTTAFGVTGYLLVRYASLSAIGDTLIAAAVGVAGAIGALTLVAAWAIPAAKAEVVDARYLLQGAFAKVTAVSEGGMSGTVVYESEGVSHTTRAAAVEGCLLEVGGDVVIERIEDSVAYVEPWARVEARL